MSELQALEVKRRHASDRDKQSDYCPSLH